jgi:hypothetical protein
MEDFRIEVLESPCKAELALEFSSGTECDGEESYQFTIPASTASFGDVRNDGDAGPSHLLDESEPFVRW